MQQEKELHQGLIIKHLEQDDINTFAELIKVFEIVFEMPPFKAPDQKYLQRLLSKEDFNAFVALLDDRVVGGLTSYVLDQYYSERPLAYIFDLAVASDLQRKGIGQALIRETKAFYKERGFEEVFVQADRVDDYAVEFYRKTNPTEEEDVLHFYYTLNTGCDKSH